jgi:hypothetical protein
MSYFSPKKRVNNLLPRRRNDNPAYLIQGQLTGDSAIARTPETAKQSLTVYVKRP